jgi:hypothetical protein
MDYKIDARKWASIIRIRRLVTALAVVASIVVIAPSRAVADGGEYHVWGTGGRGLYTHTQGPHLAMADLGVLLPEGARVGVRCRAQGDWVWGPSPSGRMVWWNWWDQLDDPETYGQWVSDVYVTTSAQPDIPICGAKLVAPSAYRTSISPPCRAESCTGKSPDLCSADAGTFVYEGPDDTSSGRWVPDSDQAAASWVNGKRVGVFSIRIRYSPSCHASWAQAVYVDAPTDGYHGYLSIWVPGQPSQEIFMDYLSQGRYHTAMVNGDQQNCIGLQLYRRGVPQSWQMGYCA